MTSMPTSCTRPSAPSPSATSTRRHRRTCWSCRATTTTTPPSWRPQTPRRAAELVTAAAAVADGRGARRLPAGLQHRRRAGPDRLPHPPAPARRAPDHLAARMSAGRHSGPAPVAAAAAGGRRRWPSRGMAPATRATGPATRARCSSRPQPPEVEAQQLANTPKGKLLPLRDGEQRMTLTMPEAYTPSAPIRHRHRRLPLLPARPARRPGRVAHRQQRAARQPQRRPPRDPVQGPARLGGRGRGQGRSATAGEGWTCFGGTGLAGEFGRPRRRQLAGGLGARRRRDQGPRTATASSSRPAPGSSCRSTTTCSRARRPTLLDPAALDAGQHRPDAAAHVPAPGAGRAAVPSRPQRRSAVRPRRRRDRREEAVRHGRQHQHAAAPPLRHRHRAERDHVLHPPDQPRHDRARRGRPHAPARPQDHHRGQPGHRPGEDRCCGSRSGTSTTRAPSRSTRSTSTPATPSGSPACTSSGCATCSRPSPPSARTATSSGPRAAPTRCASACCRSPSTTSPTASSAS